MGICSRRHFLLTICSLQLITTIERQVFDFLGFMWAPILVNFFNIIFVILGFFGAFQYRPKYIISYCIWNTLWLGWNIFIICFYLNVGILDKDSDVLNLGTGSFSWWYVNGPGCKAVYDVTEPELFRPARPTNVTDCVLDYEVIEILHATTQCILGFMAIVGGICLSKVFLEEDDIDFVGGDDFGLAGHTPLHPMYVSYSALPPPAYSLKNSAQNNYPTGTASSHQSAYRESSFPKRGGEKLLGGGGGGCSARVKAINAVGPKSDTVRSNSSRSSSRDFQNLDYSVDYLNPVDHLQRPVSPAYDEYDSLDSAAKLRYQKNRLYYPHSAKYSPVARIKCRQVTAAAKQARNPPVRPRVFIDHVRDQPLRSFYSDPRLAVDQAASERDRSSSQSKRDSRPFIEYSQPEPPVQDDSSVSPKPMTPRRVKRRSVISRDGTRRSSTRRSSVRQSRRKNPVNRIMDHQESLYANTVTPCISNLTNQNVSSLSQGTLNYDRIAVGWDRGERNTAERNWQPEAVNMAVSSPTLWPPAGTQDSNASSSFPVGQSPPAGWEQHPTTSSTRNLTDNWQASPGEVNPMQWQGQSNPTFQQTSTQSLNGEDMEELYSNRPASARSSYSNYHGVRATPQVPNRTDVVRQSQRQFVLSGPPAYQDT
ncbi:Sodium/potassium-transporting ATPase subunit beta-1-interacting protein, partial [Temnothorax longispinosus]